MSSGTMIYRKSDGSVTRLEVINAKQDEREGRVGWYAEIADPMFDGFRELTRMFYPIDIFEFVAVSTSTSKETKP